ncbi:MAG: ABC transporter permease, partial [Tepidanaerobacteraceae bacterium]|nr:ABC transporter permease [Tepidanaerobacteraceae bacterium]
MSKINEVKKGFSLAHMRLADFLPHDQNIKRLSFILLISFLGIAMLQPHIFLTKDYLVSVLYLFPEFGILALGMMLCMISGGIDLSVVATANFSGILSCIFLMRTIPEGTSTAYSAVMLLCAIILSLLIGLACGALSATLIAKIGIPPMLATLGSSDLIMGAAIALTKGSSISNIPPILSTVGTHTLFGIFPVTLLVFILCAVMVAILMNKKTYGYKLYMMGSNATASEFSGVDNVKVIFKTYMTSGLLASISGLLMCARFNSARADFGSSYTMQAILICVLGGVNPNGGFGTVTGVTLAILILQILSSGFNIFPGISNFYRDLIWGMVLLIVMAYNYISNNRSNRKVKTN